MEESSLIIEKMECGDETPNELPLIELTTPINDGKEKKDIKLEDVIDSSDTVTNTEEMEISSQNVNEVENLVQNQSDSMVIAQEFQKENGEVEHEESISLCETVEKSSCDSQMASVTEGSVTASDIENIPCEAIQLSESAIQRGICESVKSAKNSISDESLNSVKTDTGITDNCDDIKFEKDVTLDETYVKLNVNNSATIPEVLHPTNPCAPLPSCDLLPTERPILSTLDYRAMKLEKKLKANNNNSLTGEKSDTFVDECSTSSITSNSSTSGNIHKGLMLKSSIKAEVSGAQGNNEDCEEDEFVWEKYLDETGANAVPPTAFRHVECSLQSGFVKGMKLEVCNRDECSTYWVASVVMTCGPLLRLRYEGYGEDSSADFWCDLSTSDVHAIGWSAQNDKTLQPPEGIKSKYSEWGEFLVRALTGARTAPAYLLDKNTGVTPVDQIKRGMKLELQCGSNPLHVWLVSVIENVGGRLYLRYEGVGSGSQDFWLYYLDYRIHPVGWTRTKPGHSYQPPAEVHKDGNEDWETILKTALKEAQQMILPTDILKDQIKIIHHKFLAGYKLEALHPVIRNQICPATVVRVLSPEYFIVQIDNLHAKEPAIEFSCHALSPGIYPTQWCMGNGIKLTHPPGWLKSDFTWAEYLAYCNAQAAPDTWFNLMVPPHEFERGLKLEAVNPVSPHQVCAATITKISDRLLWVHLDSNVKVTASHIEDIESHNLFPVGWCESNSYPLKPPRKGPSRSGKIVAIVQPEISDVQNKQSGDNSAGGSWCPKIYFNHKCFSGPYLSKGRIAELPKSVGPGSMVLVLKEVLSMLINVAYKSCRVLKEIQLEGEPNPNMHQQVLKAKYKAKSYRATVEICKSLEQLDEFCRNVCIKLECCPNLISPQCVGDSCPENCSQLTKTKYTYYYGKKKRKIGRPPGGHTNLENGIKKAGRRKKRKNITMARKSQMKEEVLPDDDDNVSAISGSSECNDGSVPDCDMKLTSGKGKRKYRHHIPPPSAITTRGAKLPKFSFERKTHKKILLNHGPSSKSSSKSHLKTSPVKSNREDILKLHSNPLKWSINQVVEFIKTTDCAHLARIFKEHEIDGQALLLLTLPTVQEHMELKLGPAIKLCHHIERVKIAFYETYAK